MSYACSRVLGSRSAGRLRIGAPTRRDQEKSSAAFVMLLAVMGPDFSCGPALRDQMRSIPPSTGLEGCGSMPQLSRFRNSTLTLAVLFDKRSSVTLLVR